MKGNDAQVKRILDLLRGETDPVVMAKLAEEALQSLHRDDNPALWADLNCVVSASLVQSAAGRFTPELFERVLAGYRTALTVYNPDRSPAVWAQTQRNVGATYLGALHSGIGETQEYIKQAIAAYEAALRIPFEGHNPGFWLKCHSEMAGALSVAAAWRGAPALIASADSYEAALTAITPETEPGRWAQWNLNIADNLGQLGSDEFSERAIRACEAALLVLRADMHPLDWAGAHLVRGGLYRSRGPGNREENLERAIQSLDNALTVFTPDATPGAWYGAHYHRGPAWLFRLRGEREDNLVQALKSLRIAIDLTNRDQAPEMWASLQTCLGQAFLERRSGDLAVNIQSAIAALEDALTVLPADAGSPSWKLASRLLGQAYLDSGHNDAGENTARAIEVLTALCEEVPEPDDPPAWTASLANLALARTRTARGDPQSNRARAIECLEDAISVPAENWVIKDQWSGAVRKLAILYLDEKAETLGNGRPSDRAAEGSPSSWVEAKTDPLDLAEQAREQAEALRQALESGGRKLDRDSGWHVPGMLNEEAQLLQRNLNQFLKVGTVIQRNAEQRAELEGTRLWLFRAILEHLTEKHAAARRTTKLFREVERDGRPFVLFLRGFGMREHRYAGVTVGHGGGSAYAEGMEKLRLAMKLDPVPLVWISNPVESGPLELQKAAVLQNATSNPTAQSPESEPGFRVESGANWQHDVRTLIAAATFIVIHNPEMTPGVAAEVEIVEELGRLEDTFFYAPEKAAGGPFQALTEERIATIRQTTRGRSSLAPGTLPPATCPWVDGPAKERTDAEVRVIGRLVEHLARSRSALSMDLELDGYYYLLADLTLLEAVDRMPAVLSACADALSSVGDERLQNAAKLSTRYSQLADNLKNAWDRTAAISETTERLAETLRIMEEEQPAISAS